MRKPTSAEKAKSNDAPTPAPRLPVRNASVDDRIRHIQESYNRTELTETTAHLATHIFALAGINASLEVLIGDYEIAIVGEALCNEADASRKIDLAKAVIAATLRAALEDAVIKIKLFDEADFEISFDVNEQNSSIYAGPEEEKEHENLNPVSVLDDILSRIIEYVVDTPGEYTSVEDRLSGSEQDLFQEHCSHIASLMKGSFAPGDLERAFSTIAAECGVSLTAQLPPRSADFPTTAPEIFRERPDRRESAPTFVQRVYGQWLTGEFTRADLYRLDKTAWTGLRNWERMHGSSDLNLPTRSERVDNEIERLGIDATQTANLQRLATAARRRNNQKSFLK